MSLAPTQTYQLNWAPNQVRVADVSHDGIPDLLVSTNAGLVVLLGRGDGTFAQPAYYPGGIAQGLAVGDFNRDGNLDAAMATGSTVSIYLGNGDGTFRPPSSFATCSGGIVQPIVTGDFNGDGNEDIAFASGAGCGPQPLFPYMQIILGNGDGTFRDASTCPPAPGGAQCIPTGNTYAQPGYLVAADLNADGKSDLAFTDFNCYIGGEYIGVLIGNGDGTFQGPTSHTGCYSRTTVGDFNGDGKLDLGAPYSVNGGANILWNILADLPGDGAGNFASPIFTPTSVPNNLAIASGDFNGDHLSDVVAAGGGVPAAVGVFVSNGDGTFQQPAVTYPLPYGWLLSDLVAADLNGDGLPDVVAADFSYYPGGGIISVFLNTTRPPGPIGGAPSPQENPSGGNASDKHLCAAQGSAGDPCNTATGSFSHTFTDFAIPGRGLALNFAHTYSSVFASVNGPLGYGWTGSYNMALTTDPSSGAVTVHQENGAQVTFTPGSGGAYTAPPRATATLVKNGDGSFTFTRNAQQTFSFSAAGQLMKETDLNGYATTFAYYGAGRLATVTDSAGRSLTFRYSGSQIVRIKDPAGRTVAFTYDANGNLASATDVNGGVTTFTYGATHLLLTMTDPRGGVVVNTYDSQGRIVSQADPLGRTTTYTYIGDNISASGGTTTITDPKGNITVEQYRYGLRVSVTRGYGTPSAASWSYVYDPATLGIVSATDPNGQVTTKTYDASGNLLTTTDPLGRTTTYKWNNLNELLTTTDPLGVTTTSTYDANGNLLSTSTPIGSSTATTTYTYGDSAHPGDVTSMTDPNGNTWTYTYDAQGDRASATDPSSDTTTYTYNKIGERLKMISPNGNVAAANPTQFRTRYTYDPFGDVLTVTDALGHRITSSYDADRNLVNVVDPSGNVTANTYDAANELTKSVRTDSGGNLLQTLATTYDADGNVLAQINGLGIATETYSYDSLSRVALATDGLGRTTTYTYDPANNQLTLVDPSGRTTSFSYDNANELTAVAYSDATTPGVTYTYDADGQRLTMTDGTGTTSYTYDALHRLTANVQGDGKAVSYAYDLAGNLTQITYPNGKTVTRSYDTVNRLASVSSWLSPPNTVTFAYDADSNLTTETYPNGVAATFTYDRADRLTSITDAKGGTTLQRFPYTRNPDGLVMKESPRKFGYDGLNRLTSDSLATAAYAYDAADELTTLTASATTTTFGYDNANELKSATAPAGTTTYAYDNQGNRLGTTPPSGSPATYTYDQANRLTSFSRGTTTASYAYNGDGLRMSKTVNATTEPFTWDVAEGLPLVLVDGSTSYETGPGGLPLEQISAGGSVTFYHQDQLGSSRMLTNSTGTVQATYTYNAYGTLSSSTGSVSQPFGFAGQYGDAESGLIYLRARYYDPTTAQFLTVDPAVSSTMAPYAYGAESPLNTSDPTGQVVCHGADGCGNSVTNNAWQQPGCGNSAGGTGGGQPQAPGSTGLFNPAPNPTLGTPRSTTASIFALELGASNIDAITAIPPASTYWQYTFDTGGAALQESQATFSVMSGCLLAARAPLLTAPATGCALVFGTLSAAGAGVGLIVDITRSIAGDPRGGLW